MMSIESLGASRRRETLKNNSENNAPVRAVEDARAGGTASEQRAVRFNAARRQ
jgi:hypothetical protein